MSEAVGFNLVEEGVKLEGKRDLDASAALAFGLRWVGVDVSRMVVVVVHDKVTIMVLGRLSGLLRLTLTGLEGLARDRSAGNGRRNSRNGVEEQRVADPLRHFRRRRSHLRC